MKNKLENNKNNNKIKKEKKHFLHIIFHYRIESDRLRTFSIDLFIAVAHTISFDFLNQF